jgi:sulfur carrier protein
MIGPMIAITVNGRQEAVEAGTTLGGYLAGRGIDPAVAVVEINGTIVRKEDYGAVPFRKNDTVEILRFVGGG